LGCAGKDRIAHQDRRAALKNSFFGARLHFGRAQLREPPQIEGRSRHQECAYYKNIVQIEFNARHFMESDNLWACLVEHLFSNLGLPQDTPAAELEARQKQILEQIGAKKNDVNQRG
jgi:hypothetical protein